MCFQLPESLLLTISCFNPNLSVRVLNCWNVGVSEGSVNESEDQTRLADAAGTEDDHAVVVALLRHLQQFLFPVLFLFYFKICPFPIYFYLL